MLRQIPFDDEFDYASYVDMFRYEMTEYYDKRPSVKEACAYVIDQNVYWDKKTMGMNYLVDYIAIFLFQIEHDAFDREMLETMKPDILDYVDGKYDNLFTENDLKLAKADVQKIIQQA